MTPPPLAPCSTADREGVNAVKAKGGVDKCLLVEIYRRVSSQPRLVRGRCVSICIMVLRFVMERSGFEKLHSIQIRVPSFLSCLPHSILRGGLIGRPFIYPDRGIVDLCTSRVSVNACLFFSPPVYYFLGFLLLVCCVILARGRTRSRWTASRRPTSRGAISSGLARRTKW